MFNNLQSFYLKNPRTNFLICFLSGIALGLSLPGNGIWILSWISIIPLILLLDKTKTLIKALLYSFIFGFGFSIISISFLISLHPIDYKNFTESKSLIFVISGWLFQSVYCATIIIIFGLILFYVLKFKINIMLKSLFSAFIWTMVTHKLFFVDYIYMSFSSIELSQYLNLPLIQFCQYIGGIGICFIIVLFNSFIAFVLAEYFSKKSKGKVTVIKVFSAISAIGIIHLAGLILLNSPDKYYKSAIVDLLQSNGNIVFQHFNAENYYQVIKKSEADIVITPEETFFVILRNNKSRIYDGLSNIAKAQNKIIITGAMENTVERKYNALLAVIIDKKTGYSIEKTYKKQHFVPVYEYVLTPHERLFASIFRIEPRVKNILPGKNFKVIKAGDISIAPSICYDLFYPEYIKVQKKNNADMFVNLSSLIWFHNNDMGRWYNAIAVIKAAEARRPFVSCMNAGPSIIVDHKGRILTLAPPNIYDNIIRKIYFVKEKSFYSQLNLF